MCCNLFDDEMQIELAEFVNEMHNKGAKILVSNSDPKNSNNALNSESNIPQNNQNNNIPQTGNNNITNSSSSNRVKNYLNINCNIFLPKKDNNLQNSNPKGGYTNHKTDIYYYLLEELEDLEALIKSAKNELLTYNNNAKCV